MTSEPQSIILLHCAIIQDCCTPQDKKNINGTKRDRILAKMATSRSTVKTKLQLQSVHIERMMEPLQQSNHLQK